MEGFTNPYSEATENTGLENLEAVNDAIEGFVEASADLFAPLAVGGAVVAGETIIEDGYKSAQTRSKTKEMWNTSTPAKKDRENDTAPGAPVKATQATYSNVRRRPIPFNINGIPNRSIYSRKRNRIFQYKRRYRY